ncbi:sodium/proline symporter [Caldibacillus thermolactis]|jgi:sodium/proline symporter|uniref:Sodium/proline symporter n=1 Tax=Pallidibacillus thermolactis TaxID=251051 RepID=A0ABT2WGV6_9BACI|nr:sodium/proline symporter [Pallidibacillus thermolactis]MCU9594770.1 sodium/proline symporter [Pallidibacillus thermolactis]MED1674986.1 sodium/proline symporter [Pallidibacillus thermolactis subsp. kokeshiiformis]
MNSTVLGVFILYFIVIILIAYLTSRNSVTHSDFLLGGKKLPGWALAFSERATGESAWLLLGFTGFVFTTGLSGIWVAVGIAVGIIFAWVFLASRFMKEAEKEKVLTLSDYLASKFGQNGNIIRWLSTLLIAGFFMFYIGAQFAGAGKLFFTSFDMNLTTGIVLTTLLVILTAFFGGFISVVWTDMIQSIMMLLTLVVLPIIAFIYIGSNDLSLSESLIQAGPNFDSLFGGATGFAIGVLFFNNFSWFFGYLGGQPQLSARFMALKNEKEARQAKIVGTVWTILAYAGAFAIGLAAIVMYEQESFADVETVLPTMILDLTPAWFGGILLAGIMAAIITTANSQLLVVTSSVSEDIIHKSLGIKLTDKQLVLASRITIILSGLLGMMIALTSESLVYLIVSWAWAGIGCTLSPAILMTFFWKRYSSIGVIATIISGFVFTVLWISTPLDSIITSRFTTFFIAAFFGIVFSLLFPDKNKAEKTER